MAGIIIVEVLYCDTQIGAGDGVALNQNIGSIHGQDARAAVVWVFRGVGSPVYGVADYLGSVSGHLDAVPYEVVGSLDDVVLDDRGGSD